MHALVKRGATGTCENFTRNWWNLVWIDIAQSHGISNGLTKNDIWSPLPLSNEGWPSWCKYRRYAIPMATYSPRCWNARMVTDQKCKVAFDRPSFCRSMLRYCFKFVQPWVQLSTNRLGNTMLYDCNSKIVKTPRERLWTRFSSIWLLKCKKWASLFVLCSQCQ